jgi:hypothetical protein
VAAASAAAACSAPACWHPASYTGSIASLSAGVGEGFQGGEQAGSRTGVAVGEESTAAHGSIDSDSRNSSGRGSCSSQVLSVDVSGAQLQLQQGGDARLYPGGQDSVCDTPILGLASAAAVDRHGLAGLFKGSSLSGATISAAAQSPRGSLAPTQAMFSDAGSRDPSSTGIAGAGIWCCQDDADPASQSQQGSAQEQLYCSEAHGGQAGHAVQPAPSRVAKAAAAALQALISYLDKALGLRVQGMVAEVRAIMQLHHHPRKGPWT